MGWFYFSIIMKYVDTAVVFQEIPDETTLAISISNCPCKCRGCHSQYLWGDIGEPLDYNAIAKMLSQYKEDITCICFMGGDADPQYLNKLAHFVHYKYPKLKVAWYSGRTGIPYYYINVRLYDYIKIGPYQEDKGPLTSRTTNQKLFKVLPDGELEDITAKFWK